MRHFAALLLLAFASAAPAGAQDQQDPDGKSPWPMQAPAKLSAEDLSKLKKVEAERDEGALRRFQQRAFEGAEGQDGGEAGRITARYRQGKISKSAARDELRPFVELDVEPEVETLQENIVRLEAGLEFLERKERKDKAGQNRIKALRERLSFLRRAKHDPSILVERRIDLLLGSPARLSQPGDNSR